MVIKTIHKADKVIKLKIMLIELGDFSPLKASAFVKMSVSGITDKAISSNMAVKV